MFLCSLNVSVVSRSPGLCKLSDFGNFTDLSFCRDGLSGGGLNLDFASVRRLTLYGEDPPKYTLSLKLG